MFKSLSFFFLPFPTFLVPEPVYRMTNLKRLDLSHNQITELSSLIGIYIFVKFI